MAASTADKLTATFNSANPNVARVTSSRTAGNATLACDNLAGWPTVSKVHFATYRIDANNAVVSGTQIDWFGIVVGNNITSLTRRAGATDAGSSIGDVVEMMPTGSWAQGIYDWGTSFADTQGNLLAAPVKAALGVTTSASGGWDILNAGTAPTVATGYNKGNKEYTLTFAGVDLTSTLSAGMRLKFDRGTTAPTQSMSFTAASSQYATKASPIGISFTTAFTCEAWVYLNSYSSVLQYIVGRTDHTTGGFALRLNASGQLECFYGGSNAFTSFVSYQSIPLNRWIHVAASVNATTGSANLYLNGSSILLNRTAFSATSVTQISNLSVGAAGAGVASTFFNGYISEARVWSVAQTSTQIQDNMAISLTGSETNLVALFQGNGNFNDKTSNGNNLTSTGGAIATQAANPYNTTEYALVSSVTYASSNTTVTVYCGDNNNIPLMTLINPFSSYQQNPFGWTGITWSWTVIQGANFNTASTSVVPVGGLSIPITTVPVNRKLEIIAYCPNLGSSAGPKASYMSIWDGTVGSGTQLTEAVSMQYSSNTPFSNSVTISAITTSVTGSKTYNVGLRADSGGGATSWMTLGAATPAYISIKVV